MRIRCQVFREAFTNKTALRLTLAYCRDKKTEEETGFVAGVTGGTHDPRYFGSAYEIREGIFRILAMYDFSIQHKILYSTAKFPSAFSHYLTTSSPWLPPHLAAH